MKGRWAGDRRGHLVSSPAKAAAVSVYTEVSGSCTKSTLCNPTGRWVYTRLIFLYSSTLAFVPSLSLSGFGCGASKMRSNRLDQCSETNQCKLVTQQKAGCYNTVQTHDNYSLLVVRVTSPHLWHALWFIINVAFIGVVNWMALAS